MKLLNEIKNFKFTGNRKSYNLCTPAASSSSSNTKATLRYSKIPSNFFLFDCEQRSTDRFVIFDSKDNKNNQANTNDNVNKDDGDIIDNIDDNLTAGGSSSADVMQNDDDICGEKNATVVETKPKSTTSLIDRKNRLKSKLVIDTSCSDGSNSSLLPGKGIKFADGVLLTNRRGYFV